MKPTRIKVRVRPVGGYVDMTFWTGVPGYTFANVGTLRMDEDDAKLFRAMLSMAQMKGIAEFTEGPWEEQAS